MRQTKIFAMPGNEKDVIGAKTSEWKLFIDGASRNNPGPSGVGMALFKDATPITQRGFFIGKKTNNQAEYLALLCGLIQAKEHMGNGDRIVVISDSQLLVQQIRGAYKVKNSALKVLFIAAQQMLDNVDYTINHVLRHENTLADMLANRGLDGKIRVPLDLAKVLNKHGVSL